MTVYDITTLRPVEVDELPDSETPEVPESMTELATVEQDVTSGSPAGGARTSVTDRAARPVLIVRKAVANPHVRTVARHVTYVAAGALIVHRRRRDEKTTARHQRMMRAAEAQGDHQTALEWEARAAAHRRERHARRMELLKTAPLHLARSLIVSGVVAAEALIMLGIILAIGTHQIADVIRPLMDAVNFARLVGRIIAALWWPMVTLAPVATLAGLWSIGRRGAEIPRWLMPESARGTVDEVLITPSVVVVALRDLGLTALRKAIKDAADGAAAMLGPIRIAGCGVEVDVTLPSGVSTVEIQDRRRKLAENLGRHEHEVFVTIPQAARTVRLWIADSGALDEPIGPSQIVTDETLIADLYTGRAPWGQDLRGDLALIPLLQRHLLITGLSNQGKTASLRALALWAALDATVEFWIADLKGVGDWRMFDGLATILIQGPTDEHVIAATEMLEKAVIEMERRLVALERSGAPDGVTRDMARKPGSGFHPIIVLVDEAQQAFMCPAVGPDKRPYGGTKATSRYFMAARKIHNQGRAVNVVLWQGTQDPTDQNLPKLVREGAHIRASLVVGTEAQARMALGDKAVNGGAAPHKLRAGLDKGTVVVAGDGAPLPTGASSITIRTNFISGEDAIDVADRAKRLRRPVERMAGGEQPVEERDLLLDIDDVLGHEETLVKSSEVVRRLIGLDRDAYRGWTVTTLGNALAPHAVIPRKTVDGTMHVDHAEVRAALDAREDLLDDDLRA